MNLHFQPITEQLGKISNAITGNSTAISKREKTVNSKVDEEKAAIAKVEKLVNTKADEER